MVCQKKSAMPAVSPGSALMVHCRKAARAAASDLGGSSWPLPAA
jgi:hypothetical protein